MSAANESSFSNIGEVPMDEQSDRDAKYEIPNILLGNPGNSL